MTGHKECSNFISQSVSKLLENPFCFDKNSQKTLLDEIDCNLLVFDEPLVPINPTKIKL